MTAELTFDRCVCVCGYESLELGLLVSVFPVTEEESSAGESGVAACVVPVTASDRQSGQARSALQSNRFTK